MQGQTYYEEVAKQLHTLGNGAIDNENALEESDELDSVHVKCTEKPNADSKVLQNLFIMPFIRGMENVYAAADLGTIAIAFVLALLQALLTNTNLACLTLCLQLLHVRVRLHARNFYIHRHQASSSPVRMLPRTIR